jgi:hypothetical protein
MDKLNRRRTLLLDFLDQLSDDDGEMNVAYPLNMGVHCLVGIATQ